MKISPSPKVSDVNQQAIFRHFVLLLLHSSKKAIFDLQDFRVPGFWVIGIFPNSLELKEGSLSAKNLPVLIYYSLGTKSFESLRPQVSQGPSTF